MFAEYTSLIWLYSQDIYLTHTSLPLINWATIVCGGLGWPGWPVGILLLDTIVC